MPDKKPLSAQAVGAALERANLYRLLNEPVEADSICRDVLRVDASNQSALVTLLLSLSDQFDDHLVSSFATAKQLLPRLEDEYARIYYHGLLCERRARAHWRQGGHGSGEVTYSWLHRAMELYEEAEKIRPPGNDEAILRWNACVRSMERHREIRPATRDTFEPMLE